MAWKDVSVMSQREEFVVLASVEGANVSELCRRFGVSRKTGYKSLSAPGYGDAVDASGWPVRSCSGAASSANRSAVVDWLGRGSRLVQDHGCDRSSARNQTWRAPPLYLQVAIAYSQGFFVRADISPLQPTTA